MTCTLSGLSRDSAELRKLFEEDKLIPRRCDQALSRTMEKARNLTLCSSAEDLSYVQWEEFWRCILELSDGIGTQMRLLKAEDKSPVFDALSSFFAGGLSSRMLIDTLWALKDLSLDQVRIMVFAAFWKKSLLCFLTDHFGESR